MWAPVDGGDDPRVGTTVAGRYFVHRLLGRGGMGDVYEATRLEDDRPVALKLLRAADEARVRRFEREAAAARRLRHPNCVEVVDSGADGEGAFFLAMELVRGRDLARVLHEDGPLPPAPAGRVADQILAALEGAHDAGVIHRDLKPANVMIEVTRDGAPWVRVLDFGIATFVEPEHGEPRLTREGIAHGTPAYMSPEQIRGEPLDARCDLYSVGALLFEMLAGAPPFEAGSPMAVAARQLTEPAPPVATRRADVPPALAALVARALEQDRAKRPGSAAAMREELRAALEGVRDPAPRAAARALPPTEAFAVAHVPPARRRRLRGVAIASAVVAVAAIAAAFIVSGPGTTPEGHAAGDSSSLEPAAAGASRPAAPASFANAAPEMAAAIAAPVAEARAPVPAPARAAAIRSSSARRAQPAPRAPAPPDIRIVRGELNAVPTPPPATGEGVLVLQAAPWAIVSVAGAALGETPREVRLGAGTYEVRAVHPDLGVREDRVAVRAGERTLWSATFEE